MSLGVCGKHEHIQGHFSPSNSEFASGDPPFPFRGLQMQIEMTKLFTESSFNCTVCRDHLQLNRAVGNKSPNIQREHPDLASTDPQKGHTVFTNC